MGCWAWRKTAAPDAIGKQSIAEAQASKIEALEAALRNPPKHVYWGAGEPDCPRDIIAGNGELHTLLCKVCGKGLSDGRICLAGVPE